MAILSKQAQKTLSKVDRKTKARLISSIGKIERGEGDIIKLKLTNGGMKRNLYRYKIEHYRIIFEKNKDLLIQTIDTKTNIKYRVTGCF